MNGTGVGKTTLVETIVGSLPCSVGEIFFSGTNITDKSPNFRALLGFGYVPQGRGIFAKLTVEENLRMGENISKERDNIEFNKLYEFFPILSDRRGQKAGTLSGGEQQMLTICRCLMGDPELMMVDEPTEGLSPQMIDKVAELLKKISRKGISILLVEQKLTIALKLSNKVYLMGHGGIVFKGTPKELEKDASIRKEWLEV